MPPFLVTSWKIYNYSHICFIASASLNGHSHTRVCFAKFRYNFLRAIPFFFYLFSTRTSADLNMILLELTSSQCIYTEVRIVA